MMPRPSLGQAFSVSAVLLTLLFLLPACENQPTSDSGKWSDVYLDSLADISIQSLRTRSYNSSIQVEALLGGSDLNKAYNSYFSADGTLPYKTYVASYDSDGLRVYTRIDIPPSPKPAGGYPVVIFIHGWYGREAALEYDFMYQPESLGSKLIDAYVDAGFLVLSPALRGHGTVAGVPAEGMEFLEAWDNGSYISPMFYAIDVLNLLEGINGLEVIDWTIWGMERPDAVAINTSKIHLIGHSQGGDAALAALAVSGEGSTIRNRVRAGSIWSGCFGPRFEQAQIYGPMASTLEAFMSGDGHWTGSATGNDGTINPNFIFGYPSDWIGTVDPNSSDWTWQADTWSTTTVAAAWDSKFSEMYDAINSLVSDINDASFEIFTDAHGKAVAQHDSRLALAMQDIGGWNYEQYLSEALHFHHSDQDYYSPPRWNAELSARINAAGGHSVDFVYPRNNHSLLISPYDWFSTGEIIEGVGFMIERDLALFTDENASAGSGQAEDLTSIDAIRRYASTLKNSFQVEFERRPVDGIQRKVVSFHADGLKQYALVLEPEGPSPDGGWPVLLMNHGHHPNPPDYGRIEDGSTDRPGDYYRGLPLAFARQGFLVFTPDFRGHNDSESGGYQQDEFESWWYARDTIAAFRALASLSSADTSKVFMWGHSMGGAVTLRALLALGDEIRGASIWSSSTSPEETGTSLRLEELQTPLNIHHSLDDPVTPFSESESVHKALEIRGGIGFLYPYNSDHHLFQKDDLQQAIARDVAFFQMLSRKAGNE